MKKLLKQTRDGRRLEIDIYTAKDPAHTPVVNYDLYLDGERQKSSWFRPVDPRSPRDAKLRAAGIAAVSGSIALLPAEYDRFRQLIDDYRRTNPAHRDAVTRHERALEDRARYERQTRAIEDAGRAGDCLTD